MVLAKDETLVKEWEYGRSKSGKLGKETSYTLAVTNKRIVASSKSCRKNGREEITLSDVKGVSATHSTPSKLAAIIQIAIGALYLLLYFVCFLYREVWGNILFPIAIVFIVFGIIKLNSSEGSIHVSIITDGPKTVFLSFGLTKMFRRFSGGILRVKINNEAAEEIVETIGSLLLAN